MLKFTHPRFTRLLLAIVLLAFVLRLYKISNPIADWHSFRQADTASVTREFVKHGVDFLRPKYHDLANVQSGGENQGRDNVEGWRMVEFPIINGLLAYLLRALPFLDLVIVSRLASIVASLFSIVLLASMVKRVYGEKVSLLTALFFAVLPYSVYYSRVILPEPFLVTFSLASMWAYFNHLETKRWKWMVFAVLLFGVALLVKPMAVFYIPVFFGIRWWKSFDIKLKDVVSAFVFGLSFLPLLFWREWIKQYPIGVPSSDWLWNGVGKGTNLLPVYMIRFKPAWWRWIFYERLTKLFLGFFGLIPFASGFISMLTIKDEIEKRRALLFLGGWTVAAFSYVSIFAAGNVQHDYYQVPLIPFVSLALGLGTAFLFDSFMRITTRKMALIVCSFIVGAGLFTAWKTIKGYYQVNNWPIVHAGKAVDRLLPPDAKVIAPYFGDTAFLFQTNRTGWSIGFEIDKKIAEGAQYYVSVNYDDEANALMKKYKVVEAVKDYVILDLTKPL